MRKRESSSHSLSRSKDLSSYFAMCVLSGSIASSPLREYYRQPVQAAESVVPQKVESDNPIVHKEEGPIPFSLSTVVPLAPALGSGPRAGYSSRRCEVQIQSTKFRSDVHRPRRDNRPVSCELALARSEGTYWRIGRFCLH